MEANVTDRRKAVPHRRRLLHRWTPEAECAGLLPVQTASCTSGGAECESSEVESLPVKCMILVALPLGGPLAKSGLWVLRNARFAPRGSAERGGDSGARSEEKGKGGRRRWTKKIREEAEEKRKKARRREGKKEGGEVERRLGAAVVGIGGEGWGEERRREAEGERNVNEDRWKTKVE